MSAIVESAITGTMDFVHSRPPTAWRYEGELPELGF
jgi:hypothetical protein